MGSTYYYTSYADDRGAFEFGHVREGDYALQAWSGGGALADVGTSFLQNDVRVDRGRETSTGNLLWGLSEKTKLFQLGDFDRTALGFEHGGDPYTHGLAALCPADVVYRVGCSRPSDWCYVQTHPGNWTISFRVAEVPDPKPEEATLIVSLAGYSTGTSSVVWVNGAKVGELTSGAEGLLNDPSVYRSATTAGEWRYFEFSVRGGLLKEGENEVRFEVVRNSTWRGFMWDSVILEW
jgi:rhamnogalacturonan endolyase